MSYFEYHAGVQDGLIALCEAVFQSKSSAQALREIHMLREWEIQRIVDLFMTGYTRKEIANIMGVSYTTVKDKLRKHMPKAESNFLK